MNQIIFDNAMSSDDWGVILSSYTVGDAPAKENYVDIPLGDGALDLTEALTGEVSYGNRPFEALFILKPPSTEWPAIVDYVRAFLNGRVRRIRIENDPGHYLIGRCATSFETDGLLGFLTVTATCEPWKYKEGLTVHDFTIGESGAFQLNVTNSRKRVIPRFTTSDSITVEFRTTTITMNEGSRRFTNIVLTEGVNHMTITGEAGTVVTVEYQEGAL